MVGGGYVFIHALLLTITKLGKVCFLLMLHHTFANATHISGPKLDEQIMVMHVMHDYITKYGYFVSPILIVLLTTNCKL